VHRYPRIRCRSGDAANPTITAIAADLGVSEASLSAWCKAAGLPIWHGRPACAAATVTGGVETPEQELSRALDGSRCDRLSDGTQHLSHTD
jgi:hypothetical protein